MTLDKINESCKSILTSPLPIKSLLIILFVSFLINSFIFVTTNSIVHDSDIKSVLIPYYFGSIGLIVVSGIILLVYFKSVSELNNYIIFSSLTLIGIVSILLLYGFSPCLYEHTNSIVDHVHPHLTSFKLKLSFLCPSYSNRSWLNLLFYGFLGIISLFISLALKEKTKNKI